MDMQGKTKMNLISMKLNINLRIIRRGGNNGF